MKSTILATPGVIPPQVVQQVIQPAPFVQPAPAPFVQPATPAAPAPAPAPKYKGKDVNVIHQIVDRPKNLLIAKIDNIIKYNKTSIAKIDNFLTNNKISKYYLFNNEKTADAREDLKDFIKILNGIKTDVGKEYDKTIDTLNKNNTDDNYRITIAKNYKEYISKKDTEVEVLKKKYGYGRELDEIIGLLGFGKEKKEKKGKDENQYKGTSWFSPFSSSSKNYSPNSLFDLSKGLFNGSRSSISDGKTSSVNNSSLEVIQLIMKAIYTIIVIMILMFIIIAIVVQCINVAISLYKHYIDINTIEVNNQVPNDRLLRTFLYEYIFTSYDNYSLSNSNTHLYVPQFFVITSSSLVTLLLFIVFVNIIFLVILIMLFSIYDGGGIAGVNSLKTGVAFLFGPNTSILLIAVIAFLVLNWALNAFLFNFLIWKPLNTSYNNAQQINEIVHNNIIKKSTLLKRAIRMSPHILLQNVETKSDKDKYLFSYLLITYIRETHMNIGDSEQTNYIDQMVDFLVGEGDPNDLFFNYMDFKNTIKTRLPNMDFTNFVDIKEDVMEKINLINTHYSNARNILHEQVFDNTYAIITCVMSIIIIYLIYYYFSINNLVFN